MYVLFTFASNYCGSTQLFLKFVDPETAIASSKTKWKGTENNRNILAKKQNIVAS